MRIAFFDSGIGGLSVLREAQRQAPGHQYIYYADSDYAPYGSKPAAQVAERVVHAAEFLAQQNIDALVVACNTATAVCIKELRTKFQFPIIGMEPAIKPALEHSKEQRVLVLATSLTLQETKLSQLLKRLQADDLSDKLAMDRLVTFAENGDFSSEAVLNYLTSQFSYYKMTDYAAVVLGCTHFVFFKPAIEQVIGSQAAIIDGNNGTVKQLFRKLGNSFGGEEPHGPCIFYRSGVQVNATPYELLLARL